MWKYEEVSRKQFEERKDYVENLIIELGAESVNMEMTYRITTTTVGDDYEDTSPGGRSLFRYGEWYFRIDEVLFPEKPFIVFEVATSIEEVQKNIMEDIDPFPYDLSDSEIMDAIKLLIAK